MADLIQINNGLLAIGGNLIGIGSSGPSLPPYTAMLKYKDGVTPTFSKGTGVQVSSSPNIWDLTYENADWSKLLRHSSDLLEVISANTTGVTNMRGMFEYCSSLTSVQLFDTSKCEDMGDMFFDCSSLTSVPLFNTSNVINMKSMFSNCSSLTSVPLFDTSMCADMDLMFAQCSNVEFGALALYQQASTQAIVPSHELTFYNCGANTVTGAAELAQIPSNWK